MILTVQEFRDAVEGDLNTLIDQVARSVRFRSVSDGERRAMASSYPVVSRMLGAAAKANPRFAQAHITTSQVFLEYKLPAAPAWCDLVLLGEGFGKKRAVIVELKDWLRNETDGAGPVEGLVWHVGQLRQHPSDQVQGYADYCRAFHSAVVERGAEVDGCVFFTRNVDLEPYAEEPNARLFEDFPMFNASMSDALAAFINQRIERGDEEWATAFVNGFYRQNRNILEQVGRSFAAKSAERPFVLLDEQRRGFHLLRHVLKQCVRDEYHDKQVVIVEGPPGSGKSAVALNLWADSVREFVETAPLGEERNVVFATTSSAQYDNWSEIFRRYGGNRGAGGFVLRANAFNPGLSGGRMKTELVPHFARLDAAKYLRPDKDASLRYEYYEDYVEHMLRSGMAQGYRDNLHFLTIVDEAHALINPVADGFGTNSLGGWCMQMGPQAYHIIRQSRISVFFLDGRQSFRDNETTSVGDLKRLAARLGANVTEISLAGMQFRCAGSVEYVDWVERLFSPEPLLNRAAWRDLFRVDVFDTTHRMEKELRTKAARGATVRLLSSCSVPWISDHTLDAMHSRGNRDLDFDFVNEDGVRFRRHWNNPERMDIFVQAPPGTLMHEDPLCEVGCPYEIRGFDVDYAGILWLDDIVWRKDRWMLDISHSVDRANKTSRARAIKEQEERNRRRGLKGDAAKRIGLVPLDDSKMPKTAAFAETVVQAYRILLTRAVKGVCLYIHDPETRAHVRRLLAD